jgi:hypothetical protein
MFFSGGIGSVCGSFNVVAGSNFVKGKALGVWGHSQNKGPMMRE